MAEEKKESKSLKGEIVTQMLTLATAGLGLVAALAWNSAIQDFVDKFLSAKFGQGTASKFFYAIVITLFAVFVTYHLTKLHNRFKSPSSES